MTSSWVLGHVGLIVGYLFAMVGIAHMLRHRRSPGSTIAWLLVFVVLPYVGVALYLMFGGRKLRQDRLRSVTAEFSDANALPFAEATDNDRMLRSYGIPPATTGNHVSLCATGVEAFRCLSNVIDGARQTLFVAMFMFSRDAIGRCIRERLIERAEAGVSVYVLTDGLGSIKTPRRFFRPLVQAGGQFAVFKPVIHIPFRSQTNLRNHRKIVVADGHRAFAGGMNITGEDLQPEPTPDAWRDLGFVVEGPAAGHFESIVRSDWQLATGQSPEPSSTYEAIEPSPGNAIVQVLPSGPDLPNDPMYSSTLTAIFRATTRIWIATPYFVPDDAITEAIVIACRRGVDVRILVPERSNHPLSDVAGAPLLREIHKAGGTVLFYTKSMVHAKAMIVDNEFCAVGSANMDMRSLFLNYEVMQICYSQAEIDDVVNWFQGLANNCRAEMRTPGFLREIGEGVVRTISPLF
jgi:cardiolipin synthase